MNPLLAASKLCRDTDSNSDGLISALNNSEKRSSMTTPSSSCNSFGSSAGKPKVQRSSKTAMKKKSGSIYRKAPQAPKRFKPAYICFSMAKHKEIKEELGSNTTVSDVSKKISQVWHSLAPNDRAHWDEEAEKDKKRYETEKAAYTGPWKILAKPSKADANAPKRPMSSFLYYAQKYRPIVKKDNPELCNTEVSKLLGVMWKNAAEDEKQKYIQHEEAQRAVYNSAIADWHKKQAEEVNSIPEFRQEPPSEDSGVVSSSNPRPYSPHYENSGGNNKFVEQQQQIGMQTYYAQPPSAHSMMAQPQPSMAYGIYPQQPPAPPSYSGQYEHLPQSYPARGNAAYSYPQYSGDQISYNAHDFSVRNSGDPQHDYSVQNPGAPQQEYAVHNSGSPQQDYSNHPGAIQQDYVTQNSGIPQQDYSVQNPGVVQHPNESYNAYNIRPNEAGSEFYAGGNVALFQEYGNEYNNQM